MELGEREKGKENDRAISRDVKVEDIRMCIEGFCGVQDGR
jgi:hypothetical protein